ncbi:MAG: dockerin type I domain-containing protein [Phycisphaerales bacterium]
MFPNQRRSTDLQEIQDYLVPEKGFSLNGALSSFGEDAFGELFICEEPSGEIYKIVPAGGVGPDCNNSTVPDARDIAVGASQVDNENGLPDECECVGDTDTDGIVGASDLIILLGCFGGIAGDCTDSSADISGDGFINSIDLTFLIAYSIGDSVPDRQIVSAESELLRPDRIGKWEQ